MSKIESILRACCDEIGLPRSRVEVSVQVVSPAVMRRLNKKHRDKDKATDVLSFPLLMKREFSTFQKGRAILDIGDIFINRSDARTRLDFLVVHGFLHLIGYDHEKSPREEKIMERLEQNILKRLQVTQ
jgi:probable rRNA maturation factor